MNQSLVALQSLARTGAARRVGAGAGLGIPGPWGNVPAQSVAAGAYEITGTQVYLRDQPSTTSIDKGAFNADHGDNGGIIVGTPDQVDFNGQTGDSGGLRFASVTAKTGALAGKSGYVAMKYMAPIGWTASHGGTGGVQNASSTTTTTTTTTTTDDMNYTPWIVGALVALGAGGVLYALYGTKGGKRARRRGRARLRLRRIRRRR